MKRILLLSALLVSAACDDTSKMRVASSNSGAVDGGTRDAASKQQEPGVCDLAKCPKPAAGLACCTPDARCGNDPTGLGLTCQSNDQHETLRKCVLKDCPTPLIGEACCTPTAQCGWDPFASGLLCLANAQVNVTAPDGAITPACDLTKCPAKDGGALPCCQPNGQCGYDTLGAGICLPPPNCDLSKCPTPIEGGPRACCLSNGECGIDTFNIGICFVPPTALCDLAKCPSPDGGAKACCLQNGQCGVDTLGIGICYPPPSTTCDLKACPKYGNVASCCLPNGSCGVDSLGVGICFAPTSSSADGGAPPSTEPPNDPSITGECPSFLGLNGPVWGCCSQYGVCGEFASNQCLLPLGTQLPVGPRPEAGTTEPFLRCTPPSRTR